MDPIVKTIFRPSLSYCSPPGDDDRLKAAMHELAAEEPRRQYFGYRRWKAVLGRKRGLVVNHKRVRRLLHELGWVQPRFRGGRPIRPPRPTAPTGPNQVWLIDMTKIAVTDTGWLHHIAIIDACTREIVGHHESLRARAQEWLEAFNQAILERFPEGTRGLGLVIQADNESQPTARAFREALQTCGVGLAFIDVDRTQAKRYYGALLPLPQPKFDSREAHPGSLTAQWRGLFDFWG